MSDVREGDLWELPAPSYDPDRSPRTYLIVAAVSVSVRRFWYIGDGPARLCETTADHVANYGRRVIP